MATKEPKQEKKVVDETDTQQSETDTQQNETDTQQKETDTQQKAVLEDQPEDKKKQVQAIVKRNMLWSLGVGAVPVPVFDLIGITAVQVKMLKEIAEVYNVSFSENKVKNVVFSLLGGIGSLELSKGLLSSVVKFIPGAGSIAGAVTLPITAAAVTYAIGNLFIRHFEQGGSFMDIKPSSLKEKFSNYFNAGKKEAQDLATEAKAA